MMFMRNSPSHSPSSACLLLDSAVHRDGSRRTHRIRTRFDALVLSECQEIARDGATKTLKLHIDRDSEQCYVWTHGL